MAEVHIKDHSMFVGTSVKMVDRKKKEITFSFKGAPKGWDTQVSGDVLLADLISSAFGFKVPVRGLTISWSEWKEEPAKSESEAAPETTNERMGNG